METNKWESPRAKAEQAAARRVELFDRFIDLVLDKAMDFDTAVSAYLDTLEYEGISYPQASVANVKV